jgi:hypothetical protein
VVVCFFKLCAEKDAVVDKAKKEYEGCTKWQTDDAKCENGTSADKKSCQWTKTGCDNKANFKAWANCAKQFDTKDFTPKDAFFSSTDFPTKTFADA